MQPDQWSVVAEIVTSTGPVGTLVIAAAVVLRGELRRRFDRVDDAIARLEEKDASIEARVVELERRATWPPSQPVAVE